MQFVVKDFDTRKKRLLTTLGVPPTLFRPFVINTDDYLSSIQIEDNKGNASKYRIDRQLQVLEYLSTCKFEKPRIIIFESAEHYLIARQIALFFFGRAIAMATTRGPNYGKYPTWIYLTSAIKHTVNVSPTSSLVVFDNATTSATQSTVRLDKLRDEINWHNKPTIIIFQGTKSTEWCRDVLSLRPFGVVHFNGFKRVDDPTSVIRI